MEQVHLDLQRKCRDNALHCIATSYAFQKKAETYGKWIRFVNLLGIIVPFSVGIIVLGYGVDSTYIKWMLAVAVPITIIQFIVSAISLINRWDLTLSYSFESLSANRSLYERYVDISKLSGTFDELKKQYDLLHVEDGERSKQDEKFTITAKERRRGLRYALYITQIECAICGLIPQSMEPTECKTCGKF